MQGWSSGGGSGTVDVLQEGKGATPEKKTDIEAAMPPHPTCSGHTTEEGDKEAAEAYKQLSRLKYGRDRDFVDREILKRIGVN